MGSNRPSSRSLSCAACPGDPALAQAVCVDSVAWLSTDAPSCFPRLTHTVARCSVVACVRICLSVSVYLSVSLSVSFPPSLLLSLFRCVCLSHPNALRRVRALTNSRRRAQTRAHAYIPTHLCACEHTWTHAQTHIHCIGLRTLLYTVAVCIKKSSSVASCLFTEANVLQKSVTLFACVSPLLCTSFSSCVIYSYLPCDVRTAHTTSR